MKVRAKRTKEYDEAFLGAAIGAVASIVGGVIGNRKKRKQEKAQLRQEQIAQNEADTLATAQALSEGYGNQDYIDEYNKKVTLRYGGSRKTNSIKKCGGKKKAELGTEVKVPSLMDKVGSNIGAASGGISSLVGGLMQSSKAKPMIKSNTFSASAGRDGLSPTDYNTNTIGAGNRLIKPINEYEQDLMLYGGVRRKKRKK